MSMIVNLGQLMDLTALSCHNDRLNLVDEIIQENQAREDWSVDLVLEQMSEVRAWLGRGDMPDDLIGALGMWIKTLSNAPPSIEPVSIVDMAPGTRFVADVRDHGTRTFMVTIDSIVAAESGLSYFPEDIDQSTIRDVTPPQIG
jgi:hypothetical protein